MSLTELLAAAMALPRAEQLQLINAIQTHGALASEDPERAAISLPGDASFDIWSPVDAYEAAASLQELLEAGAVE